MNAAAWEGQKWPEGRRPGQGGGVSWGRLPPKAAMPLGSATTRSRQNIFIAAPLHAFCWEGAEPSGREMR